MKDTGAERRNHARERTHIEVEVWKDRSRTLGVVEYLSFGGACISLPNAFVPNAESTIQVRFDVPGDPATFRGSARVVWSNAKSKSMGVQFVDLASLEKEKLEKILVH